VKKLRFFIVHILFLILVTFFGYYWKDLWGAIIGFGGALLVVLIELTLRRVRLKTLCAGLLGLVIGLLIGNLVAIPFKSVIPYIQIISSIIFAYLGLLVLVRKKEELYLLRNIFSPIKAEAKKEFKILDTSVIIDGRIADICEAGFIEGILVVPRFVLRELQQIADSENTLKRNRGRRGLDILNRMQKNVEIDIEISEKDFPEIKEVDGKLVKLTQFLDSKVITNDFNLNKVAELEGAPALNINELALALKPVVLPGEEMTVQIIKEGKEPDQGVAYLNDGTMVVVEDGEECLGKKVDVSVTSVHQTIAGRMIFTKLKEKEG
jgi:uncharacterized protein YacL